ncbi:MAG: GGDEF domain-containing protein [Spirochaetes bacterium]|nr:GGDEF domain-containing protein [Spirochaetota bacterium]
MSNKIINNIFFIINELEKEQNLFKKSSDEFNFYPFYFEDFLNDKIKFDPKDFDDRQNNLIVINKSFYDRKEKENLINKLLIKLNILNPHFLFIDYKDCGIHELENIIRKENFFYKLSEKNKQNDIYLMLVLIFQHIKDLTRLSDYIINSFQTIVNSELINQQKMKIEQLYKELENLSKIDILTNVLNRRAFFEALDREITRTFRDLWRIYSLNNPDLNYNKIDKNVENFYKNSPQGNLLDHYGKLSCLMIDIDHFKNINDEYGHIMGDTVLKEVGNLLNSSKIFRDNDIVGRFGGEEFIVILPETNAMHAKIPAERLRNEIKSTKFKSEKDTFNITISIGIAELTKDDKSSDKIIERADKALYYAKQHGKDKCVIYDEIEEFLEG